jgi:hypothetical protein
MYVLTLAMTAFLKRLRDLIARDIELNFDKQGKAKLLLFAFNKT